MSPGILPASANGAVYKLILSDTAYGRLRQRTWAERGRLIATNGPCSQLTRCSTMRAPAR